MHQSAAANSVGRNRVDLENSEQRKKQTIVLYEVTLACTWNLSESITSKITKLLGTEKRFFSILLMFDEFDAVMNKIRIECLLCSNPLLGDMLKSIRCDNQSSR